jgi:16S rRNA G527 N7-methylase RsmG
MTLVDFWMLCSTNGIILDLEQREQFERYIGELQYWNEKINLVSRKDMENLIEHQL